MDDGMNLNWKEVSANTAYNALADTPPEFVTSLAFTNDEALLRVFSNKQQFDNAAIDTKMALPDNNFIKDLTNSLYSWIPAITMKMYQCKEQKDKGRKVNAKLHKTLKPKTQAVANVDVKTALNEMSNKTVAGIANLVRKVGVKEVDKIIQRQSKLLQKQSSGGVEPRR